jgi:peptidoglycan-associated lipoprotein
MRTMKARNGRSLMAAIAVAAVAGFLIVGEFGCSKKTVQSGGDVRSSEAGAAKAGGGAGGGEPGGGMAGGVAPGGGPRGGDGTGGGSMGGVNPNFPDISVGAHGSDSGKDALRGLDTVAAGKGQSGERLGSAGTVVAKAEPDSAARQIEEMRREQAATAAAGLRDVFFAFDSWTITEEGRQALMVNADWIKANGSTSIKIEGHCDERGTQAYNLVLGEKRAKAVRNYLVELGVASNRLAVVSYGKERPFCRDHAESCYQQNRRGHIVVRSK